MRCKTATASRSVSTSSLAGALAVVAALALGGPASAATLADLRGHLGLGYAKLIGSGSPGGSLAIGAGMELPLAGRWSAGLDLGFSLLGSQSFERGSLSADLDHSLFETLALLHYAPSRGPLSRVSLGPGLFHARAGLTTAAPAEFEDLPVEETAAGMGLGLELGPKRPMLVKAGFEIAARDVWLRHGPWTVALARLVVHY